MIQKQLSNKNNYNTELHIEPLSTTKHNQLKWVIT